MFSRLKYRISNLFLNPKMLHKREVDRWFRDNAEDALRLDYDCLNGDSLVFDLGGYKGDWSAKINDKYKCYVYIFEPYLPYYEEICRRFRGNDKIKVFPFGLAKNDSTLPFRVDNDASSFYGVESGDGCGADCRLNSICEFMYKLRINKVDLVKINIEGGEFDLLEYMLDEGLINRFLNIQVQFHHFVESASSRYFLINKRLKKTHVLDWKYEFVWESWSIGGNNL